VSKKEIKKERKQTNELSTQTLLTLHKQLHKSYTNLLRIKPKPENAIKIIVQSHDEYVKELLTRGIKHNTPLK